jgi:DNA-binding transcriptional LysR family regulator
MIDLQHLQTFLAVAITGNFRRAADALGYSQPSVTHHIQVLERELGVSLLERSRFSRSAVLTPSGRRVLQYSERLLALAAETHAAARAEALDHAIES